MRIKTERQVWRALMRQFGDNAPAYGFCTAVSDLYLNADLLDKTHQYLDLFDPSGHEGDEWPATNTGHWWPTRRWQFATSQPERMLVCGFILAMLASPSETL